MSSTNSTVMEEDYSGGALSQNYTTQWNQNLSDNLTANSYTEKNEAIQAYYQGTATSVSIQDFGIISIDDLVQSVVNQTVPRAELVMLIALIIYYRFDDESIVDLVNEIRDILDFKEKQAQYSPSDTQKRTSIYTASVNQILTREPIRLMLEED